MGAGHILQKIGVVAGIVVGGLVLVCVALFLIFPRVPVDGVPTGFTEKSFDTGEVTLNYVEGPDNGVPMLLIPGQMESWQGYKRVMSHLSKEYHLFIVDVRGQGKSEWTPGRYSYNSCGNDLRIFLRQVVGRPAVVSGLSSGAVLAVWLAAYAPDAVSAIISEDPPLYSSLWPRIAQERFMRTQFEIAVDALGGAQGRDLERYFLRMGVPQEGSDELLTIPPAFVKLVVGGYRLNARLRPDHPYDVPLFPFNMRALLKFLSEYDVDFSRATIDGRLGAGFDPDDGLEKVRCPMLLLHARWTRDERWGLLGAMDDRDAERIRSKVQEVRYVRVDALHGIHIDKPALFLDTVQPYLRELASQGRL